MRSLLLVLCVLLLATGSVMGDTVMIPLPIVKQDCRDLTLRLRVGGVGGDGQKYYVIEDSLGSYIVIKHLAKDTIYEVPTAIREKKLWAGKKEGEEIQLPKGWKNWTKIPRILNWRGRELHKRLDAEGTYYISPE